jgi:tRNA(Ile)-lysidine synthase
MLLCLNKIKGRLGIQLSCATLDHGLREGSEQDAEWVLRLCQELGVSCIRERREVEIEAGQSVEDRARRWRYEFLEESARTLGATAIATAHHGQDQVETVLWRLVSGAPWLSLKGMAPERASTRDSEIRIVRPLLFAEKSVIKAYVSSQGCLPREDPTNQSRDFLRNRLRLDVLPLLRQINPRFNESLLEQIADFQTHAAFVETLAEERLGRLRILEEAGEGFQIPLSELSSVPAPVFDVLIRRVLIDKGLNPVKKSHVRDLREFCTKADQSGCIRLSKGFDAISDGEFLKIRSRSATGNLPEQKKSEDTAALGELLSWTGETRFSGFHIELRVFERAAGSSLRPPNPKPPLELVWLDGKIVGRDLGVRFRRAGDKIRPLGMKAGRQTLKKLFQSRGISADSRSEIPVITCDQQPVWVVGVEIDDRFKVEENSSKVIEIQVFPSRPIADPRLDKNLGREL